MKITVVAHEVGPPGGMERQLGELVGGLLARGHGLTVVARECALEAHPGLRHVRVGGPRRPFSLWYPWFFLFASLAVRRHRAGLVHTTGALVLNRADVSTVHFCHRAYHAGSPALRARRGSVPYRLNALLAGWTSRAAEGFCYRPRVTRRLVAVSAGVAAELREHFPSMEGTVSLIPNGVDTVAFVPDPGRREATRGRWGVDDRELVALFVGGEWERKGLRHAIEGIARAPEWRLVVVGGGDIERFAELARRAGAGQRVRFEGAVADPAPYYAGADVFILPTAYETFSLATYEAAASGLPLLVSRVSGVEDILVQGRNGWFIDRDADLIATRLQELAADQERRAAMGAAAREDSARFGWSRAVDAYERLYLELEAAG